MISIIKPATGAEQTSRSVSSLKAYLQTRIGLGYSSIALKTPLCTDYVPIDYLPDKGVPSVQLFSQTCPVNILDQNKLREQIRLESPEENDDRQLTVQIAKDFFVVEIRKNIKVITDLCEKYRGKQKSQLIAEAEELIRKANDIDDVEKKDQLMNEASDLFYVANLPMKKAELIRNPLVLVGSIEKLQGLLKRIAKKHGIPELAENDEILTLTAYYCTKSKYNQEYILDHLPDRLIKEGSENFESRVRLLTKHILLDLNEKKLVSARDVELYLREHNYTNEFKEAGLTSIWDLFSFRELAKLTFPEQTSGDNPEIRDWFMARNLKGDALTTVSERWCAWVLEYAAEVYDKEAQVFNIEKMKELSWREIFEENGLSLESIPKVKHSLEAIRIGARKLGVNDLIGHERENQLHEWDVKRMNMWKEKYEDGSKLIDYVTDFLLEVRLREKYPEMYEDNGKGKGKVLPKELVKINLSEEYELIAPGGLQNSKMSSVQALKRRYSECFGWSEDKIKPPEVKSVLKFQGVKGEKLFAKGFAYCLSKGGLGKFNPLAKIPILFTKSELIKWKSENLKSWDEFFKTSKVYCTNIASAYDKLCDNSIVTAFEMLLGPLKKETSCFGDSDISPADERKFGKSISITFIDSGKCRIEINASGEISEDDYRSLVVDPDSSNLTSGNEKDELPIKEDLVKIEKEFYRKSFDEQSPEAMSHRGGENDPVYQFLKEMGEIPLLKREEEIELAKRIAAGGPDSLIAKNKLVEGNLRLVVHVAKQYLNKGLSLLDLVQEGSIGLMHAAEKHDHSLGFKFGTYAFWWIRRAITRALSDTSRTIRVPVHMVEAIRALRKTTAELSSKLVSQGLSRKPTKDELAHAMGITVEKIDEIIAANKLPFDLESSVGNKNGTKEMTMKDCIEDDKSPQPVDSAIKSFLKDDIEKVLKSLTQREREIIELRFGLKDGEPKTLDEIAEIYGLTRARIGQIEAAAMAKLQQPHRNKQLKSY